MVRRYDGTGPKGLPDRAGWSPVFRPAVVCLACDAGLDTRERWHLAPRGISLRSQLRRSRGVARHGCGAAQSFVAPVYLAARKTENLMFSQV